MAEQSNTDWIIPTLNIASNLGANVGSGVGARKRQRRQQEYTRQNMQAQQNWAEHMSSTAYQRTVNDMRQAGLNPLMMYGGASGASQSATPSGTGPAGGGGSANIQAPDLSKSVATAFQIKQMKQDIKESQARVKKNDAEKDAILINALSSLYNFKNVGNANPSGVNQVLSTLSTAFQGATGKGKEFAGYLEKEYAELLKKVRRK